MEGASYLIDYGDLLARFCLSFVFLWSGVSKALHPAAGRAEVAALGLPDAELFLWLTVAGQIAGGLMVLLGFWARLGALALLGFTVIATLLAHGTRGLTGEKRQQQETTTFEHLAIVGGFLFVIIHGAGRLSVDNLLRRLSDLWISIGECADCNTLVQGMAQDVSAGRSVAASDRSPAVSTPSLPPLPVAIETIGVITIAMLGYTISSQLVDLAIADVGGGFSISADEASWIACVATMAEVAGIPIAATLVRALSLRTVALCTGSIFALCALASLHAWSEDSLLVFRAMQSFCTGILSVLLFVAVMATLPRGAARNLGLAVFAFASTAPAALNASVGGFMTEHFGWVGLSPCASVSMRVSPTRSSRVPACRSRPPSP